MRNSFPRCSDQELVTLLLNKEEKGIDILYNKYGTSLYSFITPIVKQDHLAELVLQDTFLKVWNNIEKFNFQKGIFITWMIKIARNTAIDMTRSKYYNQTINLLSFEDLPLKQELLINGIRIDHIDIKDIIYQLDSKYSKILECVFFKEFTYKEVSNELRIPLGTVKSRIRKAFKDLRKLFAEVD